MSFLRYFWSLSSCNKILYTGGVHRIYLLISSPTAILQVKIRKFQEGQWVPFQGRYIRFRHLGEDNVNELRATGAHQKSSGLTFKSDLWRRNKINFLLRPQTPSSSDQQITFLELNHHEATMDKKVFSESEPIFIFQG